MTRQEAIDFLDTLYWDDKVTYGLEGSDLGTPVEVHEALADIMNMDDDSWNDGDIIQL